MSFSKRDAFKALTKKFNCDYSDIDYDPDGIPCPIYEVKGIPFSILSDGDITDMLEEWLTDSGLYQEGFLNKYSKYLIEHINNSFFEKWLTRYTYGEAYDLALDWYDYGNEAFVEACVDEGLATEQDFQQGGEYYTVESGSDLVYKLSDRKYDAMMEDCDNQPIFCYKEIMNRTWSDILIDFGFDVRDFARHLTYFYQDERDISNIVGSHYGYIFINDRDYNLQEW